MSLALALGVGLERDKNKSLIRGSSRKAKASDGESSLPLGHITQHVGNLLADRFRIFERGSRRRLDHDDEISLVFIGYESARHSGEYEVRESQSHEEQHNRHKLVVQKMPQESAVTVRCRADNFVNLAEQPVLLAVFPAQQQGGERRGQSQ